jgi:hypothetical protein
MNRIVHVVKEAKAGSTKGEEIVKKVGLEKKNVPTLEKFSGEDEDFYAFQDSTMNRLKSAFYASRSIMQSWQKIRILSVHFYWLLFKMTSLRQYVIILFTNQHYPFRKF